MRKICIPLIAIIGVVYADMAVATLSCSNGTCTGTCQGSRGRQVECFTSTDNCFVEDATWTGDIVGCQDGSNFGGWRYWVNESGNISHKYVSSCGVCATGYTRTKKSGTMTNCSVNDCILDGCSGYSSASYTYYSCECSDTKCAAIEDWTELGNGYDKRPVYACQSGECLATSSYKYRCSGGYYGTSNAAGTSGCTRCPKFVDDTGRQIVFKSGTNTNPIYGYSYPYDSNTDITSCFIPNDLDTYKDTYGAFDIMGGRCFYQN